MYKQVTMEDTVSFLSPLAQRMRPRNFDEYIGQDHILGEGKILRKAIENDEIGSMILWGPPGVGKTTLAVLIANMTQSCFKSFSAVSSSIKDVKKILLEAKDNRLRGIRTILFIDEIHRFNKAQQDAFLPDVEKGNITLIGATTENPSFEVNSALLSRSMVVVLKSLKKEDILKVLRNAIVDKRGLGYKDIVISDECLESIAEYSNGDVRIALNMLEIVTNSAPQEGDVIKVSIDVLKECMQKNTLLYSKHGEEHFNIISALHKSMRNSDCDAAVYWLSRMLEAGEDPLYIARRLIRFASEDVGLAEPNALVQAIAAYNAAHYIGMPECSVNLVQAVIFLSVAPKSNSLYVAYNQAKDDAVNTSSEEVPLNLRNATSKLMEQIGCGKGYQYAHSFECGITNMQCLPDKLKNCKYYIPTNQGEEKKIKDYLNYLKEVRGSHL